MAYKNQRGQVLIEMIVSIIVLLTLFTVVTHTQKSIIEQRQKERKIHIRGRR